MRLRISSFVVLAAFYVFADAREDNVKEVFDDALRESQDREYRQWSDDEGLQEALAVTVSQHESASHQETEQQGMFSGNLENALATAAPVQEQAEDASQDVATAAPAQEQEMRAEKRSSDSDNKDDEEMSDDNDDEAMNGQLPTASLPDALVIKASAPPETPRVQLYNAKVKAKKALKKVAKLKALYAKKLKRNAANVHAARVAASRAAKEAQKAEAEAKHTKQEEHRMLTAARNQKIRLQSHLQAKMRKLRRKIAKMTKVRRQAKEAEADRVRLRKANAAAAAKINELTEVASTNMLRTRVVRKNMRKVRKEASHERARLQRRYRKKLRRLKEAADTAKAAADAAKTQSQDAVAKEHDRLQHRYRKKLRKQIRRMRAEAHDAAQEAQEEKEDALSQEDETLQHRYGNKLRRLRQKLAKSEADLQMRPKWSEQRARLQRHFRTKVKRLSKKISELKRKHREQQINQRAATDQYEMVSSDINTRYVKKAAEVHASKVAAAKAAKEAEAAKRQAKQAKQMNAAERARAVRLARVTTKVVHQAEDKAQEAAQQLAKVKAAKVEALKEKAEEEQIAKQKTEEALRVKSRLAKTMKLEAAQVEKMKQVKASFADVVEKEHALEKKAADARQMNARYKKQVKAEAARATRAEEAAKAALVHEAKAVAAAKVEAARTEKQTANEIQAAVSRISQDVVSGIMVQTGANKKDAPEHAPWKHLVSEAGKVISEDIGRGAEWQAQERLKNGQKTVADYLAKRKAKKIREAQKQLAKAKARLLSALKIKVDTQKEKQQDEGTWRKAHAKVMSGNSAQVKAQLHKSQMHALTSVFAPKWKHTPLASPHIAKKAKKAKKAVKAKKALKAKKAKTTPHAKPKLHKMQPPASGQMPPVVTKSKVVKAQKKMDKKFDALRAAEAKFRTPVKQAAKEDATEKEATKQVREFKADVRAVKAEVKDGKAKNEKKAQKIQHQVQKLSDKADKLAKSKATEQTVRHSKTPSKNQKATAQIKKQHRHGWPDISETVLSESEISAEQAWNKVAAEKKEAMQAYHATKILALQEFEAEKRAEAQRLKWQQMMQSRLDDRLGLEHRLVAADIMLQQGRQAEERLALREARKRQQELEAAEKHAAEAAEEHASPDVEESFLEDTENADLILEHSQHPHGRSHELGLDLTQTHSDFVRNAKPTIMKLSHGSTTAEASHGRGHKVLQEDGTAYVTMWQKVHRLSSHERRSKRNVKVAWQHASDILRQYSTSDSQEQNERYVSAHAAAEEANQRDDMWARRIKAAKTELSQVARALQRTDGAQHTAAGVAETEQYMHAYEAKQRKKLAAARDELKRAQAQLLDELRPDDSLPSGNLLVLGMARHKSDKGIHDGANKESEAVSALRKAEVEEKADSVIKQAEAHVAAHPPRPPAARPPRPAKAQPQESSPASHKGWDIPTSQTISRLVTAADKRADDAQRQAQKVHEMARKLRAEQAAHKREIEAGGALAAHKAATQKSTGRSEEARKKPWSEEEPPSSQEDEFRMPPTPQQPTRAISPASQTLKEHLNRMSPFLGGYDWQGAAGGDILIQESPSIDAQKQKLNAMKHGLDSMKKDFDTEKPIEAAESSQAIKHGQASVGATTKPKKQHKKWIKDQTNTLPSHDKGDEEKNKSTAWPPHSESMMQAHPAAKKTGGHKVKASEAKKAGTVKAKANAKAKKVLAKGKEKKVLATGTKKPLKSLPDQMKKINGDVKKNDNTAVGIARKQVGSKIIPAKQRKKWDTAEKSVRKRLVKRDHLYDGPTGGDLQYGYKEGAAQHKQTKQAGNVKKHSQKVKNSTSKKQKKTPLKDAKVAKKKKLSIVAEEFLTEKKKEGKKKAPAAPKRAKKKSKATPKKAAKKPTKSTSKKPTSSKTKKAKGKKSKKAKGKSAKGVKKSFKNLVGKELTDAKAQTPAIDAAGAKLQHTKVIPQSEHKMWMHSQDTTYPIRHANQMKDQMQHPSPAANRGHSKSSSGAAYNSVAPTRPGATAETLLEAHSHALQQNGKKDAGLQAQMKKIADGVKSSNNKAVRIAQKAVGATTKPAKQHKQWKKDLDEIVPKKVEKHDELGHVMRGPIDDGAHGVDGGQATGTQEKKKSDKKQAKKGSLSFVESTSTSMVATAPATEEPKSKKATKKTKAAPNKATKKTTKTATKKAPSKKETKDKSVKGKGAKHAAKHIKAAFEREIGKELKAADAIVPEMHATGAKLQHTEAIPKSEHKMWRQSQDTTYAIGQAHKAAQSHKSQTVSAAHSDQSKPSPGPSYESVAPTRPGATAETLLEVLSDEAIWF